LTLPNGAAVVYGYDNDSRLTGLTYQFGSNTLGNLTYGYDQLGQRTQVSGSFARTGLPGAVTSATYDAANELTNWNGLALSYDANGNMLSDGTNAFTWNARNQVAKLNNVSLQYDAFGRRIQNAAGTSFLYDGANAAQELSGSAVTANLLSGGIDEIFNRADSAGTFSPLKDALGSTIALVDSSGNIQTSYTYDPYGGTSVTGTNSGNEFQYTGRESEGNGLYFYRARYYSPLLGRFISQDPLGFAGGDGNLYAYVFGDPINFFDPSGTNAALDPAAVARAARTAFEVIEGGKESGAIVAVEAAEIGGLGAADAALLAEEIQDVQTYNAENAAYDAELQAIHNLN
jgi:RHS repeat-associated protein